MICKIMENLTHNLASFLIQEFRLLTSGIVTRCHLVVKRILNFQRIQQLTWRFNILILIQGGVILHLCRPYLSVCVSHFYISSTYNINTRSVLISHTLRSYRTFTFVSSCHKKNKCWWYALLEEKDARLFSTLNFWKIRKQLSKSGADAVAKQKSTWINQVPHRLPSFQSYELVVVVTLRVIL